MKICHLADVHWRSLSRHDEYREVFAALVEKCKLQAVDHIVVAGDLFHTKTTGLSPEYIDIFTWWLKELSSAAPVHLVLGNHDGNLLNKSRQDAVSPIVSILANDRTLKNPVHLYKKSGVYSLDGNHNLCVFSLFDEEGWHAVQPISGQYNIAVYHGPVNCAVTETGFDIHSDVTLKFFEGYDLALLGDIHRRQHLGYRAQGDKEVPWISYPGTPVQQSYAESLDHGYLLWSINRDRTHSVEFIELPNPKPFITVDWKSAFTASVPKFSRVRIRHNKPLGQADLQRAIDHFKDIASATEVVFSLDSSKEIKSAVASKALEVRESVHSPSVIMDLLRQLDDENSMSEKDWQEIKVVVEHLMKQLQSSDTSTTARSVGWSIKDLKFDNLFGYGDGNNIDFSSLSGIVGVFGQNRVGKSSIIGALMYCLFNGTDRGSIKNIDVVNTRKDYASARAVLNVAGSDYVVERQTTKQYGKREVSAPTAVNLFKVVDGEAQDMNGEQRADTDKLIKALIGTPEDFMLTSLSAQGDIDRFIKEGSTHRKSILTRFLDLDFFDRLQEHTKSDLQQHKAEMKLLSLRALEDAELLESQLAKLVAQKEELTAEKLKVAADLSRESEKIAVSKKLKQKFDSLEQEKKNILSLKESSNALKEQLCELDIHVNSAKAKVLDLKNDRDKIDLRRVQESILELEERRDQLKTVNYRLEKVENEHASIKRSLRVLDEVPCGDDYPTCKFIKNVHADKPRLEGLERQSSDLRLKVAEVEDIIKALCAGAAESAKNNANMLDSEIMSAERSLHALELKRSSVESKLQVVQVQISSLSEKLLERELQTFDRVTHEALEKLVESLSCESSRLESEILKTVSAIATLQSKLDSSQAALQEHAKVSDSLRRIEFINYAFSKKGLPARILSEQLPLINREIAGILAGVVDFSVELECNSGSAALDVYINYGDSRRLIELCSGMEKMISSVVIRAALTNVTTIPKSDLMIIDEGFGALDESSVEACKRLLVSLKRYYKTILIISHVPGIKDVADSIIEVSRHEKDSRISS